MTTRDIQAQLQELYGVEVSPALISNVTKAVMEEVRQWQTRPLEPLYPIVYVDCLVVVTSLITYPAFHHKLSTPRSLLELCAGTSFPHHLSMRQTWSRKVTMRIPRASKTGPSDLFLDVPAFL
jgi:hypothetical protein